MLGGVDEVGGVGGDIRGVGSGFGERSRGRRALN